MAERVLVRPAEPQKRAITPWTWGTFSRAMGWAGAALAAAALADYAIALYPTAFASAEWEFGTISQIFAGLPLLSIGLAAIWVSASGLARRRMLLGIGVVLLVAAACVLVCLGLFSLDIPVALKGTQGLGRLGIKRLIAKTLFMGLLFGGSYVVMGVLALKQARGNLSSGVGT